jgi:hypothetical protein
MTSGFGEPGTPWGLVEVTLDHDGLVVVSPRTSATPPAVRGARLDLTGGTLVVDVTREEDPPVAVLGDSGLAQAWLTDVSGVAVADEVERVAAAPRGTTAGDVAAVRGHLSSVVSRIGVGTWLHRWWPDRTPTRPGVDVGLLELELGALLHEAEICYGPAAPAARFLRPHLEMVADRWESLERFGRGARDTSFADLLARVLAAAVDDVDAGAPGWRRCADHFAALTELRRAERAVLPTAEMWSALERVVEPEPAGRPQRRSRTASDVRSGSGTVDVVQVPPRVVSAEPDNYSWQVHARGQAHDIEVTVAAAFGRAAYDDPGLHALVKVGGVPTDVRLLPSGDVWRGRTELVLPVRPGDQIVVAPYHPDFATTLRTSPRGELAAAADRVEIDDILDGRLADLGTWSFQAEHEAAARS